MLPFPARTSSRGFSLIEILIVISILATLASLGFVQLRAQRQRQQITNNILQIRSLLDEARIKSTSVTPDTTGAPASWAVLLDPQTKTSSLVPLTNSTQLDTNPLPAGSRTFPLPAHLNLQLPDTIIPPSMKAVIVFQKLTGAPLIYKKPPGNNNNLISVSYDWNTPFTITVADSQYQQSVFINEAGTTSTSTIN